MEIINAIYHTIQPYYVLFSSVLILLYMGLVHSYSKQVRELEQDLLELDAAACEYYDSVQEQERLRAKTGD